jgi:hypothetical protein
MSLSWLISPSSHDSLNSDTYSVPMYTKILASTLKFVNFCGGIEEFLSMFFFFLGVAFAIRTTRSTNTITTTNDSRSHRRSLLRSPMTVCFLFSAICYRSRPRSIKWSIPAKDYYILNITSSNGGSTLASSSFLLSPSSPLRDDLSTKGKFFRDELNRVSILRGVNLGGSSKLPSRPFDGETFRHSSTLHVKPKDISFVDRPFPLSKAPEHFSRLAAWGFTFIRLQITWEAVEHAGPGIYDDEYLIYLLKLIRYAKKYNINVFIDPHQDVWSRFTGGSGAPAWTLEKVGFNVTNLHKSGAAFVHQEWSSKMTGGEKNGGKKGKLRSLPGQVWGHNYARLASATMFTLFFGGRDFAPNLMIDNVNIQDYLQNHFFNAMSKVANILQNETNVIGFDTLNEPNNGYIGFDNIQQLHLIVPFLWDMSHFSLMTMASGYSYSNVPFYYSPMLYGGSYNMNPNGISAWINGPKSDIWRKHGVWDVDPITKRPKLLKADYFHKKPNGNDIDFTNDYMVPFYKKFESVIRKSIPNAVIFAEPHINIIQAWKEKIEPKMPNADRFVWVPHYYDLLTLLSKSFRKWIVIDPLTESISFNPIQVHTKMMLHQLEKSKGIGSGFNVERRKRERESSSKDDDDDDDDMLGSPALVGETGICFDQYNGEAYHHTLPG